MFPRFGGALPSQFLESSRDGTHPVRDVSYTGRILHGFVRSCDGVFWDRSTPVRDGPMWTRPV